jgi:hypothetical protein
VNHHYPDIVDRLGTPQWWDEHAVPRYCTFAPQHAANIYAAEVCLLEIACQDCATAFRVCMSVGPLDGSLAGAVEADTIHYGDPPNAGCCAAGPTMNSVPLRVLEFWAQGGPGPQRFDWIRRPKLERVIPCGSPA